MQVDAERKIKPAQDYRKRSLSEFIVDLIIGFFRIFSIPFKWLNVQMKYVIEDKKKKDKFTKWYSKHKRRSSRLLRLNNEF